uniref:Putative secreted protein n=1 Tax=Anopheles darlingi TaxID=43151 RepID=A0A2M4D1L5_ANODA
MRFFWSCLFFLLVGCFLRAARRPSLVGCSSYQPRRACCWLLSFLPVVFLARWSSSCWVMADLLRRHFLRAGVLFFYSRRCYPGGRPVFFFSCRLLAAHHDVLRRRRSPPYSP